MTNSTWAAYNNKTNEGGEGYNPHPKHTQAYVPSELDQLEDEESRLVRIMNCTSFESFEYPKLEEKLTKVRQRINELEG